MGQIQVQRPFALESLPVDYFDGAFQDAEEDEYYAAIASQEQLVAPPVRLWVSKAMMIIGEASVALVLLASPTRFF